MNQFIRSFVVTLLVSVSLFAQIIESKKMSDILNTVSPNALVIFDLDNTIMEAGQTIGSDQWFDYRVKIHERGGYTLDQALTKASEEWEAVNYKARVKIVEPETVGIIQNLQMRGIRTMGLTARPATFLEESLKQLNRLDVHFDRETVSEEHITLKDKDVATFKDGLMSVGGNNKGTILVKLLKYLNYKPGRILFVDDKLKNVTNVDNALKAASILSFAYRYSFTDEKVAAFDSRLADFQYQYFLNHRVVLTDKEARALIK